MTSYNQHIQLTTLSKLWKNLPDFKGNRCSHYTNNSEFKFMQESLNGYSERNALDIFTGQSVFSKVTKKNRDTKLLQVQNSLQVEPTHHLPYIEVSEWVSCYKPPSSYSSFLSLDILLEFKILHGSYSFIQALLTNVGAQNPSTQMSATCSLQPRSQG